MPTISFFFGMVVVMFWDDHPPPHFHVVHGSDKAVFAIEDGALLRGRLKPGAVRLVREWAGRHRAELLENWERCRLHEPLMTIVGADEE
jgi:hypothetical protein